jgi:hypothetical protein
MKSLFKALSPIILISSLISLNLNCMDSTPQLLENQTNLLKKDETILRPITFKGTCTIDGKEKFNLSFAKEASITVAENSTLCLKNITIQDIDEKIKLASTSSRILFAGNVTWKISEFFNFEFGSFAILSGSRLNLSRTTNDSSKSTFFYKTDQVSFLGSFSTLELENIKFSYCPKKPITNLISLTAIDSCIYLNNSQIFVEENWQLTSGCIYLKDYTNQFHGEKDKNRKLILNNTPIYPTGATREVINVQIIQNDTKYE